MDEDVETPGCCFGRNRKSDNRESQDREQKGWCLNLSKDGRTMMMVDLREFCLSEILVGEHHDDLVFTVRGAKFTYGLFIDSLLNTSKYQ